jgi:hypothetical protein
VSVSTVNNPSEVIYFTCALGFKIDEILAFIIVSKCRVKRGNSDYWVVTVTAVRCKWGEVEATYETRCVYRQVTKWQQLEYFVKVLLFFIPLQLINKG